MEIVELGPRQLAPADAIHRRPVGTAPLVGERGPVDLEAFFVPELLALGDHRRPPVDDGAEGVEDEHLDVFHFVGRTLLRRR